MIATPSPGAALAARKRGRPIAAATALLTGALALVLHAAAPATATDDPALEQTVEADEATVEGREAIGVGHVDLGPRLIDDEWRLQARDDRTHPPVWRFPSDVVFQLTDEAVTPAPDNDEYAFLDAEPGSPLYVVPQTQEPDVIWLGWNTQDPEVVERIDRGATLTLHDFDGPGEMFLFLQEGVAGAPNVLWDSTEGFPQDLWMEVNTHTHANWVFTEPGIYRLAVEMHADFRDDRRGSETATLRFAVGDSTDIDLAFDADDLEVAVSDAETSDGAEEVTATGRDDAEGGADARNNGIGGIVVGIAAGTALLVAIVVWRVISGRRARDEAERARGRA